MKYKVGDEVRIKNDLIFNDRAVFHIRLLEPEGITTVSGIENTKYLLKGLPGFIWEEDWLEDWLEEVYESIHSRFEILDL